jgi:hypothetical protein
MASLIDCLFMSIFFGSVTTAGVGADVIAATGVVAGTGALTAVGFATTGADLAAAFFAGAVIFLVMIFSP